MSDTGVTQEGFVIKRLDELLSELNAAMKAIFGEDFNTSPESPDGQVNGVVSASNADLWELAQACYNAYNPSAATGVALSNLVQVNGITREPATSTRVVLTIGGTEGALIPAGSLVSSGEGTTQYSTVGPVTIPAGGSVDVNAEATITGPIEATAGSLTTIETPIVGWDTVTNNADGVLGTNEETDPELRARRSQSVARDAQAIIDAIFAEVANVTGVTSLLVLENDTDTTDGNGLPPHSVRVIVRGGDDQEIGEAIFLKKTIGAETDGTTTVQVNDIQGLPNDISFQRPTETPIYVTVNLTTFADFPADGADQIKQAIIDYAEGNLVQGREFSMGDDIIHSELYTPINSIQGHTVDSLFIGTSPSPAGTADIAIAFDEVGVFETANIVVNT